MVKKNSQKQHVSFFHYESFGLCFVLRSLIFILQLKPFRVSDALAYTHTLSLSFLSLFWKRIFHFPFVFHNLTIPLFSSLDLSVFLLVSFASLFPNSSLYLALSPSHLYFAIRLLFCHIIFLPFHQCLFLSFGFRFYTRWEY